MANILDLSSLFSKPSQTTDPYALRQKLFQASQGGLGTPADPYVTNGAIDTGKIAKDSLLKSLGNIWNDTSSIVRGIPQSLQQLYYLTPPGQEVSNMEAAAKGVKNTNTADQVLGRLASGLVDTAGKTAGIGQNGKLFDPQEALQYNIEHPVSTALNIAAGAQGVGALKGALKGAETADIAAATPKELPAPKPQFSQAHINDFQRNFNLSPTEARNLQAPRIVKELLNHGMGGSSTDEISSVSKQLSGFNPETGRMGLLTDLTYQALDKVPKEVNISSFSDAMKSALSDATNLNAETKANISSNITNQVLSPGSIGSAPDLMSASGAYKAIQSLQARAAEMSKGVATLADKQQAAIYRAAAGSIQNSLNSVMKDSDVINTIKTPATLQAIRDINPAAADDIASAKTFGDLRHAQEVWTKASQMADITASKGMSGTANLANSASRGTGLGAGLALGSTLSPVLGPIAPVVGAAAGYAAAPTITALASKFLPGISYAATDALTKAPGAIASAVQALPGQIASAAQLGNIGQMSQGAAPSAPQSSNPQTAMPGMEAQTAPSSSQSMGAISSDTSTGNWQTSQDGQYKFNPDSGISVSMDGQWKWDVASQAWQPNQQSVTSPMFSPAAGTQLQSSRSNGLPDIPTLERMIAQDAAQGGFMSKQLQQMLTNANNDRNFALKAQSSAGAAIDPQAQANLNKLGTLFFGPNWQDPTATPDPTSIAGSGLGTGTVAGAIRPLLGNYNMDTPAGAYQGIADIAGTGFAKILAGGSSRVNQQYMDTAKELIPQIGDSPEKARQKLLDLQDLINGQNYIQADPTTALLTQLQSTGGQ